MIAYVNGILEYMEEDTVVLDVSGVGINIKVPTSVIDRLPQYGEPVKLYTYTAVREDAFQLYGFLSRSDLAMYKKCISVSGIGPKVGLGLLSAMDADSLRYAIISQDKKTISKAPGIGAKTAERLILELKDSLAIDDEMISREIAANSGNPVEMSLNDERKEAVEALTALGYGRTEVLKVVNGLENIEGLDSGAILKLALKKLF